MRTDHPLRVIKSIVNEALSSLEREFASLYSPIGRPSIPPEKLLRAMLLQAFYSIRSERIANPSWPIGLSGCSSLDPAGVVTAARHQAYPWRRNSSSSARITVSNGLIASSALLACRSQISFAPAMRVTLQRGSSFGNFRPTAGI